jgi:hypothetical protein
MIKRVSTWNALLFGALGTGAETVEESYPSPWRDATAEKTVGYS